MDPSIVFGLGKCFRFFFCSKSFLHKGFWPQSGVAVTTTCCHIEEHSNNNYQMDDDPMADEIRSIAMHNGSYESQVGFGGDYNPSDIIPSVIARRRQLGREEYVGQKSLFKHLLSLYYPIEKGVITNWDDMEKIWKYSFRRLTRTPEEHPVLLTDGSPEHENSEKMTEIMFERFNIPALYVANPSVLSGYATGRTTCLVLDCGEDKSHSVPLYEGYRIRQATRSTDMAGRAVTNEIIRALEGRGLLSNTMAGRDIAVDIKENYCLVAHEGNENIAWRVNVPEQMYELPDGTMVDIREEREECPEVLFQPSLICQRISCRGGVGCRKPSAVHEIVIDSIQTLGADFEFLPHLMAKNIVLCGGTSRLRGFSARLQEELESSCPLLQFTIDTSLNDVKYSSWLGGSILSSLSTFQQMWISRWDDYDEFGPSIVLRKCF